MHSETTKHLHLVLCTFLEMNLLIVGFCGSLGTVSNYNKAKLWHHHYGVSSICMLSLFMKFEINLLIVGYDIKVAGHSRQLGGPRSGWREDSPAGQKWAVLRDRFGTWIDFQWRSQGQARLGLGTFISGASNKA